MLLSGCVLQPLEAQEPIDLAGETVPTLAIAPISGPPGTTIFASGAGWEPSETVYVNLEATPDEEAIQATVAIATADDDGRFNVSFMYPLDPAWAEPGEVTVAARSVGTGKEATAIFVLEEPVVTPTPSPTATQPGAPTATATPTWSRSATVISNALNVRRGPSTAFPVIVAVKRGTVFTVLGQNNSGAWLLVRTDSGVEGWVARAYTDFTGTAPVVPSPRPPAVTPTPTPRVFAGWRGEYYANATLSGQPALIRDDSAINFDWGLGSPAPGIPADNFSARWMRTVSLTGGTYRFFARADDGVRVWVDGALIIDQWRPSSGQTHSTAIGLSSGAHQIRVEYYEASQYASVAVWWEMSGGYPDWRGEYYANPNLTGLPAVVRNDTAIDFDWGRGSPAPGIPVDLFSVRWMRQQHFDSGTYRFHAVMDDGMRIFVDDQLIIDEWRDGSAREVTRDVYLGYGTRTLRVEYYERTDYAVAKLWWERVSTPEPDHFPDWKGEYWSNRDLSGSPTVVRNDRHIDFNWGSGSPDWRIPDDDFSARWTRRKDFSAGTYRFYARADDGVRVYVNDNRIINEWHDSRGDVTYTADIWLDGRESLKVEYYERSGGARIEVWWEKIDHTPTPTVTATATSTPTPTRTPVITPNPYADVSPSSGAAGTQATVSGGGFPANTRVNLYLGGLARSASFDADAAHVYATTVTDRMGGYSMTFTVPDRWSDGSPLEPGRLVLLVATASFDVEASATFEYRAPAPTQAPDPYAQIAPSSGGAGTQVTVSGGGFPANRNVFVHLAGLVSASAFDAASPHVYASGRTDGNGNYSMAFSMPENWPDGRKIETGKLMVVVATSDMGRQASAQFDYFVEAYTPSIDIRPGQADPGTNMTVSGGGFPAMTTINLYLGALDRQVGGEGEYVYATTVTDRNGNYSMAFKAPATWPDGSPITEDRLVAMAATRDFSVQISATFRYTPAPAPTGTLPPTATPTTPAQSPSAAVNPSSGDEGTRVRVSGGGFPANRTVTVYLASFDRGGGPADGAERYATTTTDDQGEYGVGFRMPGDWPNGEPIAQGPVLVIVATDDFGVQASAIFQHAGSGAADADGGTSNSDVELVETPSAEPTVEPTSTPEPTATEAPTQRPTRTPAATEEAEPPTDTPEAPVEEAEPPTDTPVPPTDTPEPPTDTPEPPTDTPEPPTDTPEPPTDTPEPPTDTPEPPTDTPEPPTDTPVPPTDTPEPPTDTPEPPTDTPEPPTDTPVPPTATATPTMTVTPPPQEEVGGGEVGGEEPGGKGGEPTE